MNASNWQNLTNAECIRAYNRDFVQDYQNLVLVSNYTNITYPVLDIVPVYSTSDKVDWFCFGPLHGLRDCNVENLISNADNWTDAIYVQNISSNSFIKTNTYPIDYCLAQPSMPACKVQLGQVMLVVVIICNAVKVGCIMTTIFHSDFRPLITTGDALASFLDIPDDTTATYGPVTAYDIRKREYTWLHTLLHIWVRKVTLKISSRYSWSRKFSPRTSMEPGSFQYSKRYRWFQAASVLRWTVAGCLYEISPGFQIMR